MVYFIGRGGNKKRGFGQTSVTRRDEGVELSNWKNCATQTGASSCSQHELCLLVVRVLQVFDDAQARLGHYSYGYQYQCYVLGSLEAVESLPEGACRIGHAGDKVGCQEYFPEAERQRALPLLSEGH